MAVVAGAITLLRMAYWQPKYLHKIHKMARRCKRRMA
ncbi:hypothetical protein RDI58_015543 [Solanum bulbocastanum]|uniref:Uncharacterized protein n=1 Tax=Solanum bulbocastanum TaxID=147425 RepID=A0AAN8YF33_SOLBU